MATAQATQLDFLYEKIIPKKPFRIAILTARWNWEVTGNLLHGAKNYLDSCGLENLILHEVPGSYELIYASSKLASQKEIEAVICLGCVIKGETPHFDFICQAVSNGIANATITHGKPIAFGVLTTNTMEQALERAGGKLGNKGAEAAATVVSLLNEFVV